MPPRQTLHYFIATAADLGGGTAQEEMAEIGDADDAEEVCSYTHLGMHAYMHTGTHDHIH
jgi:hypothetical protein